MKIRISVDSACDLPKELKEKYKIKTIPYYVMLGDRECVDGVNVTSQDLFDYVKETGVLPKTAAISAESFKEYFVKELEDCDHIIHFTLSSKMTSSYTNAVAGAQGLNVSIVDSASLSSGIALLVLSCARKIQAEKGLEQILKELEEEKPLVQASFLVDTLKFLHKGGRCSSIALISSKILKIKPKILVKDGKMEVAKKYMGNIDNCLIKYVEDTLEKNDPDKTVAFCTHSSPMEISAPICNKLREFGFKEVYDVDASSTISCHCGPKTLGILFMNKQ